MKIKPAIRTKKEIEQLLMGIGGTWVKYKNAEKRLIRWSNELIDSDIEIQRVMIRKLRADGAKERDLIPHFNEITKLELMKI